MRKFFQGFGYAWRGIWQALAEQRNIKVQLGVTVIVAIAGFYFNINYLEWCVIIFCMALVLSLELINSAIEDLVNLVTLERKPLVGKVKDIAAGAVLVAAIAAAIVGCIIFSRYIF